MIDGNKTTLLWFLTVACSVKPCYSPFCRKGNVLLSESSRLFIHVQVRTICFIIRQADYLVCEAIFLLNHITYYLILHSASIHPQVRITPHYLIKCLNLLVLIPVVKEPINRFILSQFVVTVSLSDLICPRVIFRPIIMVHIKISVRKAKILSTTLLLIQEL